jgi:hypothetical protein
MVCLRYTISETAEQPWHIVKGKSGESAFQGYVV